MSFTGDLEHLPIVDVIQLLHATRKSGVLRVTCRKGESQLVFKEGYMVSANHLNNNVRIGQILSDLDMITPEVLDQALQEQASAGPNRKPLIITLLEKGYVKEEDAYKGLEHLIELTIVEILTWKKGTFTLDVLPAAISDEYKYYPNKMNLEVNVDTQSILMDALRIYDEKMRDGELSDDEFDGDPDELYSQEDEDLTLSADDLGLGDLDQLEPKPRRLSTNLDEPAKASVHQRIVSDSGFELSVMDQEKLLAFFEQYAANPSGDTAPTAMRVSKQSVIFLSHDDLVSHAVTTVCKRSGIPVFTTNEHEDIDPIIAQTVARNSLPVLVIDAPVKGDPRFCAEDLTALRRQKKQSHPDLRIIQIASAQAIPFALQAYADGVSAVFPRTLREESRDGFLADTMSFPQSLLAFLSRESGNDDARLLRRLKDSSLALRDLRDPPEIALAVLKYAGAMFERAITLIVRESEVVAEKSIGVKADRTRGVAPAMGISIPLNESSLLFNVIEKGIPFYGTADDEFVTNDLFTAIGAPAHPVIVLLPLKNRGKTIAVTYGDFGAAAVGPVEMDLLEILANQAELVLENALYRKRVEKPSGNGH